MKKKPKLCVLSRIFDRKIFAKWYSSEKMMKNGGQMITNFRSFSSVAEGAFDDQLGKD